jgi:DNA-directed RNA polymerase subunit N (RpoN/RPB10)
MRKCIVIDRHAEMGETAHKCFICGTIVGKSFEERTQEKVDAVPQETKQKILGLMWSGKSIGEVKDELGIDDTMVVCGVINQNIAEHKYLRTKAL